MKEPRTDEKWIALLFLSIIMAIGLGIRFTFIHRSYTTLGCIIVWIVVAYFCNSKIEKKARKK